MGVPEFDLDTTDRLLTTTRSVRKRLDLERPVELDVVRECLGLALQAATGGDNQRWRWIIVADEAKRERIGEIYAECFRELMAGAGDGDGAEEEPADLQEKFSEDLAAQERLWASVDHLIENMRRVPVLVVPCVLGRLEGSPSWVSSQYGSVYPAVWNFLLALRSRGLASCITCAHLEREQEVAEVLGIPYEEVLQVCLLPVAHHTGTTFGRAARRPMDEVVFVDEFDATTVGGPGW
jgi:nitroreductase